MVRIKVSDIGLEVRPVRIRVAKGFTLGHRAVLGGDEHVCLEPVSVEERDEAACAAKLSRARKIAVAHPGGGTTRQVPP